MSVVPVGVTVKVVNEAHEKLQRLHEQEATERGRFYEQFGR